MPPLLMFPGWHWRHALAPELFWYVPGRHQLH